MSDEQIIIEKVADNVAVSEIASDALQVNEIAADQLTVSDPTPDVITVNDQLGESLIIQEVNGDSLQVAESLAENIVINETPPDNVVVQEVGAQGPKGDPGISIIDLALNVSSNGQTQFNIFQLPTGNHVLLIDGIEYYFNDSYTITQSGGNTYLNWLGEFQLTTTDKLIFRKY
jgi:hypothetical protein